MLYTRFEGFLPVAVVGQERGIGFLGNLTPCLWILCEPLVA